ncbi:MAG: site-2 protease family protein [Myxococcota bacterium]
MARSTLPPPSWPAPAPATPQQRRRAVLFFVLTLVSVYLVFGYQWMGGDPLTEAETAWGSLKFAATLMAILLAHEMGHYLVARYHGFALSLPYFLPFPFAFGTLGAVIRLKSMPKHRTALLEMGAAGPLAGFVLSIAAIAVGLPYTVDPGAIEMMVPSTPPPVEEPSAFWGILLWPLNQLLMGLDSLLSSAGAIPEQIPDTLSVAILANPPLMDVLGILINGEAPGRYANLDPIAFAGWVGCLLTAINLIPIGQLDGGHILNAIQPRAASVVARVGLGALLVAGALLWPGWAVWAFLLWLMNAWLSLPVPEAPTLTTRAKAIAGLTLAAFFLTVMPRPIQVEQVPLDEIRWVDEEGRPTDPPADLFREEG